MQSFPKKFWQINLQSNFWLNLAVNILAFLIVILPISTIISQLILTQKLPNFLLFWKEFLVSFLILILVSLAWNWRILLQKKDWFLVLILFLMTFWILLWSIFVQRLSLNIVILGFRFELWWLYFWVIINLAVKILQNWQKNIVALENLYQKEIAILPKNNQKLLQKDNQNLDSFDGINQNKVEKTILKTKNLENSKELSINSTKILPNLLDLTTFKIIIPKINSQKLLGVEFEICQQNVQKNYIWLQNVQKKLHLCVYFGFFLVVLVFEVSQFLGQNAVLTKLGFTDTASQNSPKICDLVDFGQSDCRLSAGFASPNHLAAYLLLILPVFWHDSFN